MSEGSSKDEPDPEEVFERETAKPVSESRIDPESVDDPVSETEESTREPPESITLGDTDLGSEISVDVSEVTGSDLFSFDYLDGYEEIEKDWAWKPYSYVSVLLDTDEEELLYHVNEPAMNDFEEYVVSDLNEALRDVLIHESPGDEDAEEVIKRKMNGIFEQYADELGPETLCKATTISCATSSATVR